MRKPEGGALGRGPEVVIVVWPSQRLKFLSSVHAMMEGWHDRRTVQASCGSLSEPQSLGLVQRFYIGISLREP